MTDFDPDITDAETHRVGQIVAPLHVLRVVQFGTGLAPQMVGLALAGLGADVVRVGQADAQPLAAILDRGKRIVGIEGDSLAGIASTADVIIGETDAPAHLSAVFAGHAICLDLPAFPSGDARFLGKGTEEGTVLAAAGVLAERGPSNRLRGLGPGLLPMPVASTYAAAFGTLGVVAALYDRQRSGRGARLEVPLFNALMEGFSYNHIRVHDLPSRYADPRLKVGQSELPLPEPQVQSLVDPMYRSFLCADDVWFFVAIAPHDRMIERFLRLLEIWDTLLAEGLGTDHPYRSTQDWRDSANGSVFSYPKLAAHWRERIRSDVTAAMRKRPSIEWEQAFADHGLCGTVVRSSAEWLASDPAHIAGLADTIVDPLAGKVNCPGLFAWAEGAAKLGERQLVEGESLSWKGEKWYVPSPSGGSRQPFLSGVTALDLCNVIAGPTVAGCLTRFGAEVIKVDPTVPGFDPSITVLLSVQSARGKQSLLLDVARPEGRAALDRMLPMCDLVTFNGTAAQLEDLRIGHDELSRINPAIVLAQVSAFGGPRPGPLANRKGVDEVLQAATGVMYRLKRDDAPPEEYAHFGTIDVATGVWGAAAAVAGMIAARNTGKGCHVATSLAAGAAAVQMPYLWSSDRLGPAPDPVGGTGDGIVCLGHISGDCYVAPDGKSERMVRYADLRVALALAKDAPETRVGFVRHGDHPIGCTVDLVTQCAIVPSDEDLVTPGLPSKYGADTRAVLARFGFTDVETNQLLETSVAAERWPHHDMFLPD